MRNHKQVRYLMNPLNTRVCGWAWLAAEPLRRDESRAAAPGTGRPLGPAMPGHQAAAAGAGAGRDGRSGNLGLNGYARDTTPSWARNVVSFRNAWSCGTSTAASVPCMFSHLGRDDFEGRTPITKA
jgi:lipid A ethanolaminephosphotransferase